MGPEAILLSVLRGAEEGSYRFVCPTCFASVEKRADRKIVALLVSAGVDLAEAVGATSQPELDYTGEGGTRSERHPSRLAPGAGAMETAPPFTIDDVIRFHFLLEDDRFLEGFFRGE